MPQRAIPPLPSTINAAFLPPPARNLPLLPITTQRNQHSSSFDEFDGWLVQSDSSNRKDWTKTKMLIIPPSKNGTPINSDKDWMKHLIGCTEEAEKLNLSLHCELISRHSTS